MKYKKITIKGYPGNVVIFFGGDEKSESIYTHYDSIYRGKQGEALASHLRGLSRRGQINFIKKNINYVESQNDKSN